MEIKQNLICVGLAMPHQEAPLSLANAAEHWEMYFVSPGLRRVRITSNLWNHHKSADVPATEESCGNSAFVMSEQTIKSCQLMRACKAAGRSNGI